VPKVEEFWTAGFSLSASAIREVNPHSASDIGHILPGEKARLMMVRLPQRSGWTANGAFTCKLSQEKLIPTIEAI
jgi:hypothetical protein